MPHVYVSQLMLAYIDWYPFETEESNLDRHTPDECLVCSAWHELELHDIHFHG